MYVVGATQGRAFEDIRKIVPNHFLLVPGVGAQGKLIGRHSPACFFKRVIVTACGHLEELLSHRLDFPDQFVLPSE